MDDEQTPQFPLDIINEQSLLMIDAVPQRLPINISENICDQNKNDLLYTIFDDFTLHEFKSLCFLLMDHLGVQHSSRLSKQNLHDLKETLFLFLKKHSDNSIVIELLGTMKMYEKLRKLGICYHVYNSCKEEKFNKIDGVWKLLYSVCEELTDDDVEILKKYVSDQFREQINTAEDWFFWAFQENIFCKADLTKLEEIFNNHPTCLNLIRNFEVKLKPYDIRTPTTNVDCGIALIINFEKFDKTSGLGYREGSTKDADSLKNLWHTYGFKTEVRTNLSAVETLKELRYYASINHSNYDAFVCCILSHGTSNCVYSSNGEKMSINSLIAEIVNSPTLAFKPKLFFIQACQGTNIPQGVGEPVYQLKTHDVAPSALDKSTPPPLTCDVLLAISSIDGYVSFRSVEHGSWFIHALCNSMIQYGVKFSILDVMTIVNKAVRKKAEDLKFPGLDGPKNVQQIVNCTNTLEKILILKKRID